MPALAADLPAVHAASVPGRRGVARFGRVTRGRQGDERVERAVTAAPSGASRRPPRQARSAETRRRLLDAGFVAFAAKGHDGVNLVEDVLEPAGISIGSFYHQFADKTELLREILAEAAARRREFIVQLGELDPSAGFEAVVHQIVRRLYESLDRDAAAWQLQRVTRVTGVDGVRAMGTQRDQWDEQVARLLARWFDASPARRRRAADLVVAMARGIISDHLDAPPAPRGRDEAMRSTAQFVVGGLRSLLGEPRTAPR